MSMSHYVMKEMKDGKFYGETNVEMKLSACHEGGTKKTLLLVTLEIMLGRHNSY